MCLPLYRRPDTGLEQTLLVGKEKAQGTHTGNDYTYLVIFPTLDVNTAVAF